MNVVIILVAKYFFLVSILLFFYALWEVKPTLRKDLLKLSTITFPLSYVIAKVMSYLIYDPRPFVVEHITPLIAHAPDNGFPSDHTLLAMTIACIIFVYNRKLGIILACVAVSIGIARVAASIHHPLDIIGSIVIAIVATYFGVFFMKRLHKE